MLRKLPLSSVTLHVLDLEIKVIATRSRAFRYILSGDVKANVRSQVDNFAVHLSFFKLHISSS